MGRIALRESTDNSHLTDDSRKTLLRLAQRAVAHGTHSKSFLEIDSEEFPECLMEQGAAFVSVYVDGDLRGCTGDLEAHRSLVSSVSHNAHTAAFLDDRFSPIRADELPRLRISISVLTPPVPIEFRDEADLLRKLEPGIDGLTITAAGRQATFLPQVWHSLAEPEQFLAHLKHKAGLPLSPIPGLQAMRYRTETFSNQEREID